MRVNIYDVAKKSGLSTVTVSRVINNSPRVREYNRKKVLDAMKELGYSPSAAARSLAMGNTGMVGLVTPTMDEHFFNHVIMSINYNLMNKGYFLAISLHDEMEPDGFDRVYIGKNYLFQVGRVDGIILLSPLSENDYIKELEQKNIPFVLMDNQEIHDDVSSILVDNYEGGYMVTNHLIELGHKKIGFIGGNESYLSTRERKRGFKDALNNIGLEPFVIASNKFDIDTGYKITKKWIKEGIIPTAIFAADDYIALGAIDALREENILVPLHVSVCGYDNYSVAASLSPPITSVDQPIKEMSKKAVEILLGKIKNKKVEHEVFKFSPRLIVRDSSGPVFSAYRN